MRVQDQRFHANAKLLITGEYLVLKGSKALAIPLKFGQSLGISKKETSCTLRWVASEYGQTWFEAEFDQELDIIQSSKLDIAQGLQKTLKTLIDFNPDFKGKLCGVCVETDINFDRRWGLGTSSTLISLLAQWAEIDPFALHFRISNGSGYDIACANAESPIIYQLIDKQPIFETLSWNPLFSDNLYFVYTGRKEISEHSVRDFQKQASHTVSAIKRISEITEAVVSCNDFDEFLNLMEEHESIISQETGLQRVKEKYFSDFQGLVKSLGAWGGDFVLVASKMNESAVRKYFSNKGLTSFFKFNEIQ